MWRLAALGDELGRNGLVVSVSSLLIMLVFHPLAKNAILMGRSISHAVLRLLACGDDDDDDDSDNKREVNGVVSVSCTRRRHCERCAARRGRGEEDNAAGLSGPDVAAVMARLGMAGRRGWDEAAEVDEEDGLALPPFLCGGCEAVLVAEELAESKAVGEGELREAFAVFDRDGDGFVCAGELWRVLRRLGMREGARYEDCARMVAARDADGDGRVSFGEFRAMMEDAV